MCEYSVQYLGQENDGEVYRAWAACGWYGNDCYEWATADEEGEEHEDTCPSEAYLG